MEFQANSDAKIESLTKERVDEALRRLIKPDSLVIVTAGDFEKVEQASSEESDEGNDTSED